MDGGSAGGARRGDGVSPAVLALVVFTLVLASVLFTRQTGRVAAIWPTNAVVFAAMLLSPAVAWRRLLPAGLAGILLANLVVGADPVTVTALTACNAVEIAFAFAIMRRFAGGEVDLGRQRHLLVFLAACIGSPIVSGLMAAETLAIARQAPIVDVLREWVAANALGLLIVTPALLALTPDSLRALWRELRAGRGWTAVSVLVVTLAATHGQNRYNLYFLVPPALVLMAFRLGVGGAAFALLTTALVGVVTVVTGGGSRALLAYDITSRLQMVQLFIATMTVMVFPIAAALEKRRRLEAELREANRLAVLADQIGGVGHWRNDLVTGERIWSEQAYEIHGLAIPRRPRRPWALSSTTPKIRC